MRWKKVIEVIIPFWGNSWVIVGGILALQLLPLILLCSLFLPSVYESLRKSEYFSILIILISFFALVKGIKNWSSARRILREDEHYIILFLFAIYTAIFFGYLNYGLYISNPTQFSIKEELLSKLSDKELFTAQKVLKDSQNIIATCQEALKLTRNTDSISVVKSPSILSSFLFNKSKTLVFKPALDNNISVEHQYLPAKPPQRSYDSYVLSFTIGSNKCLISSLIFPNVAKTGSLGNRSKQLIVELLEEKIKYQNKNYLFPRQRDVERLSTLPKNQSPNGLLLYFLYDSVLRLIGGSSGYINPLGQAAMFFNVIFSTSAYLYFASLIGIIVKRSRYPNSDR